MKPILPVIFIAFLGSGALAQGTCPHTDIIASLAETVLQDRTTLAVLDQPRYGDMAAFMAIRYGGADAPALFDALAMSQRPPNRLDELRGAYALSQPAGLAAWQSGDPAVLDRFLTLFPSDTRALLLADQGKTYFVHRGQIAADGDLKMRLQQTDPFGILPAFAVADQPETDRIEMARHAEDTGQLWPAAALLADLPDRSHFDDFLVRHQDAEAFAATPPRVMLGMSSIGTLTGNAPLRGPREGDPQGTLTDMQFFTTMKAGMAGQPADFLGIFMNQTGQADLSAAAGQRLLDAVQSGALDPAIDPEAAWLLLYETLLAGGNAAYFQQVLGTFDFPSPTVRSYAGTAMQSLDVMIAKDVLGQFLRGTIIDARTVPAGYSGTLAWDDWVDIAFMIREAPAGDLTPAQAMMATELYWETGRYENAINLAAQQMEPARALDFMNDAMLRLDAECGGYVGVPGSALRYGTLPVYTFD